MITNLFTLLKNNTALKAALDNPIRVYGDGEAPEKPILPYAVYYTITATPENTQDKAPEVDGETIQVNVYGKNATECQTAAIAVRDAIESLGHITRFSNLKRDAQTKACGISMDVDIFSFR